MFKPVSPESKLWVILIKKKKTKRKKIIFVENFIFVDKMKNYFPKLIFVFSAK